MKIAVIGGNGFIGSNICEKLNCHKITRENYLDNVGEYYDVLIDASGNSSKILAQNSPDLDFEMNVENTFKHARLFKFNTYIYLSTCEVYEDISDSGCTKEDSKINVSKLSNYGLSKYLAECIVQKHCKKWLILRLNGILGKRLKKGPIFDLMNGGKLWISEESRFQFIHTDYISDLIKLLIDRGVSNEIINVTGMGYFSLEDAAKILKIEKAKESPVCPFISHRINLDKANSYMKMPESAKSLKLLNNIKMDKK